MNLRQGFARFSGGLMAAVQPPPRGRIPEDFPDIAEWLFGHQWPKDPNDPIYPSVIGKVATAYACISLIANHVATAKPTFYRGTGKSRKPVEREKGNIVDVWESANGTLTGFEMERDRQMWLDDSGSAYIYCERDSDAYPPHALWNMPSHLVIPVPGPGRRVIEYLWGDTQQKVRANRVLAWRYLNPGAETAQPELVGLSPLAPIQRTLSARASMVEWLELVFQRGGGTSLVLNIKDNHGTGINDAEGLHRKWQMKYGGKKGFLQPIFLKNVELLSKGFGPHDIKWEEISRQLDLDILRVFHMPPVLMGIKEGGGLSDAGSATDWQIYALCTLAPRIRLRDAVLTEHYCPMWGEEFSCETDMNQVPAMLDMMLKQAVQVATLVEKGIWTPNEGREATKKEPHAGEGADDLKKAAPPPVPGDPGDGEPPQKPQPRAVQASDPRAEERRSAGARRLPYEQEFEKLMRGAFRRDLDHVEARLREIVPAETYAAAGNGAGVRLLGALEDADLLDPTDPELEAEVQQLYEKIMKGRTASAAGEVAGGIALDIEARGLAALIEQEAASLVTGIRETTRKKLAAAIHEGIIEQRSYQEILSEVRAIMAGRINDAAIIARTETNWAYNYAAMETWVASGVETVSWLTIGDDAVRDSHRECEAAGEIPIGSTFPNGLRYPGERTGDPSESIGCRCVLQPGALKLARLISPRSREASKNGHGHRLEHLFAR